MKKILLTTTALIALGMAPAAAADLAARPYTKAPAAAIAINNWTGFYLGAMGGYAQENTSDASAAQRRLRRRHRWLQLADRQPGVRPRSRWRLGGRGRNRGHPGSRVGRLHDSLDWVPFVAASATPSIRSCSTAPAATRGLTTACTATALGVSVSDSQFHSGWTVGAGVEVMFAPKWSVKAEYLYRSFEGADLLRRRRSGRLAGRNDQSEQRSGRRELSLLRLLSAETACASVPSNRDGGVVLEFERGC